MINISEILPESFMEKFLKLPHLELTEFVIKTLNVYISNGLTEIYQFDWQVRGLILFGFVQNFFCTPRRIFLNLVQFLSPKKPCKNRVN